MTDADTPAKRVPGPRQRLAAEVDRAMVVAEAKLLCRRLDAYLELMGNWIAEGPDKDAK